jgi:hypothetical protein
MAWNANPPVERTFLEADAIVYRWTDKAMDEGCGVILVSPATREWTIYSQVPARSRHWDQVSGSVWKEDSPEVDFPADFNARLVANNQIVLG